jgi:hypothetical protein
MFRVPAAVLLFLGGFAFFVDSYALDAAQTPAQQSAADEVLTNDTLIKLVKAGIRDDVIVGMINIRPGQYSVGPSAVIAMKEAGVSDDVIAAMVNRSKDSTPRSQQESQVSKPTGSPHPFPSPVPDVPTTGKARKLTVTALSHSTSERAYTVTTPQTTNTNCDLYPNSVNCRSTSYGGGSQNRAIYFFRQVVIANEGGSVTQYTLSRTARWIWSSMDWLNDGERFHAEITGRHMFITVRRGGNQGKKEVLKFDIVDIRPAP